MDRPTNGAHLDAELLCEYAEGTLAPAARRDAEGHLAACAECRRELAAVQGYFQEMKGLEPLKAPDRFLTKVHGRIAQASPWKRLLAALSSPRLLPVPLAGLAVLLMGVYFFWLSPQLAEQAPEPVVALSQERSVDQPTTGRLMKSEPAAEPAAPPPAAAPAPPSDERIARYEMPRQKPKKSAKGAESAGPPEAVAFADKAKAETRDDQAARSRREGAGAAGGAGKDAAAADLLGNQATSGAAGGLALAETESKKKDAQPGRAPADAAEVVLDEDAETENLPMAQAAAPAKEERIASAPVTTARRAQRAAAEPPEPAAAPPVPAAKAANKPKASRPVAAAAEAASEEDGQAPWPPVHFTLRWGRTSPDAEFRTAVADLGVRILRQEPGRVELVVPRARFKALEAYLRGLGKLSVLHTPTPGDGPLRLTLRMVLP